MSDYTTNDELKRCSKCNEYKPKTPEYFSRDKNRKDGFYAHCKLCQKEYRTDNSDAIKEHKKLYHLQNKTQISKNNKAYYAQNRDNVLARIKSQYPLKRLMILDYKKKYHQENKERIKERLFSYRKNNRQVIAKKIKKWIANNPEKYREMNVRNARNRRARIFASIANFSLSDESYLRSYFDNRCVYCGRFEDENFVMHLDHFIPLAKGGQHTAKNIVTACGKRVNAYHPETSCNLSKGGKDPYEWISATFDDSVASEIIKRIYDYFDSLE